MDPLQTTIKLLSNASQEMNKQKNISALPPAPALASAPALPPAPPPAPTPAPPALASAPAPTPAPYPAGKDIPAVQFSNLLSRNDLKVGSWIKITSSSNNNEYPGVIIGINQNKSGKNIYQFVAYNSEKNKLVERNISNNKLDFKFIKPMTDEEIGAIILNYGKYYDIQKKFYENLLNKVWNKLIEIKELYQTKFDNSNKLEFNNYLNTITIYKAALNRNNIVRRSDLETLIEYPKYIDDFIKKMRQKISLYDIVEYKKNNKIMIVRINKIENNKIKISNNPWIVNPRQETKNINEKNIVQVLGKGDNQVEIKNIIKKYITEKINGIVSYYSDDSTEYSREIIKKVTAFLENIDLIPPSRYTQLLDIIDVVDKKRLKLSKPKSGLPQIPVTPSPQIVPEKPPLPESPSKEIMNIINSLKENDVVEIKTNYNSENNKPFFYKFLRISNSEPDNLFLSSPESARNPKFLLPISDIEYIKKRDDIRLISEEDLNKLNLKKGDKLSIKILTRSGIKEIKVILFEIDFANIKYKFPNDDHIYYDPINIIVGIEKIDSSQNVSSQESNENKFKKLSSGLTNGDNVKIITYINFIGNNEKKNNEKKKILEFEYKGELKSKNNKKFTFTIKKNTTPKNNITIPVRIIKEIQKINVPSSMQVQETTPSQPKQPESTKSNSNIKNFNNLFK